MSESATATSVDLGLPAKPIRRSASSLLPLRDIDPGLDGALALSTTAGELQIEARIRASSRWPLPRSWPRWALKVAKGRRDSARAVPTPTALTAHGCSRYMPSITFDSLSRTVAAKSFRLGLLITAIEFTGSIAATSISLGACS